MSANRVRNLQIYNEFAPSDPRLRAGLKMFVDLMPAAKFRPVTFIGQTLWDQQVDAFDQATHHDTTGATPEQALAVAQKHVQDELDRSIADQHKPLLNWRVPLLVCAVLTLILACVIAIWWSRQPPLGRLGRSEALAGYLFASPWIIGLVIFTIGPVIASVVYSFCAYDVLHPARFIGLENYRNLAFNEPLLWPSLYNAGWLALWGLPLGLVLGLGIALLLNAKVAGMSAYRTAFYLPSITPIVAAAMLWPWILDPTMGPLNVAWNATVGAWFHAQAPGWLADPTWSKASYVLLSLWTVGGGMILWLAGLQGVPRSLYEAAEIDGAGPIQQFKNVTLPFLTPYIFFNLIIGTIGSLQRFSDIYIMSGPTGGPVNSTMVPVLLLFNNAFQYFKMGYASAFAWIIFILVLIPSLIQVALSRKWVYYEGERAR
jgi:ABC-type sugar transport system permease subunit